MNMSKQLCSVVVAVCLLCGLALCVGQVPIVEDVCPDDNLSCERNSTIIECFSRNELCNGISFCADRSDEGQTTGTGLDCKIVSI